MYESIDKIVLASNNSGKLKEMQAILSERHWQLFTAAQLNVSEIEETGVTFVENALLKARHASHVTQLPALGDDTGLVVPALHGAPGIYSARYAGKQATGAQNIAKLLTELQDIPESQRQAYFYCVIVLLREANDSSPIIAQGRWEGMIASEPRGNHGFGYDAIFYLPQYGCTAAELLPERKNQLSHRALALKQLLLFLQ